MRTRAQTYFPDECSKPVNVNSTLSIVLYNCNCHFFFAWFSRRETMWTCIFVVEAKTRLAEENGMENSVFLGLSRTKHWPESERTHKQWTLSIELYVQHKGRVRSVYLQHLFFRFQTNFNPFFIVIERILYSFLFMLHSMVRSVLWVWFFPPHEFESSLFLSLDGFHGCCCCFNSLFCLEYGVFDAAYRIHKFQT